jgi:hypothetical protein
MEHKLKKRSHNLSPFLGIFGFWDYVMGMGMSTHGFTHVWAHFVMYKYMSR